jgi:hypothetical protein
MYTTLHATVRQGRIELLDNFTLPENVPLLVTVLDDPLPEHLTLAQHLQRGLTDVLLRRTVVVRSEDESTRAERDKSAQLSSSSRQ